MRLLLSFILLQLAIFSFGQIPTRTAFDFDSLLIAKSKEVIGKPFPKFVAANEECKTSNDSLLGKVVLINFWFEGCHPCLAEFDGLNELAQTLKENKDFEFISFTWDNTETVKRVKEKYKLQFKVFSVDPRECKRLNLNSGFPTTFILDRQGKIKYFIMGGTTDTVKAKDFVLSSLLPEIRKEF